MESSTFERYLIQYDMFDMFGNIEEQQKAIREKLEQEILEHASADGKVRIRMNANRRVLDITIAPELVEEGDAEQIEDLLLIVINEASQEAEVKAEAEMRKQISDLLPGGLGSLFGQ